jgi:hypothetical protein
MLNEEREPGMAKPFNTQHSTLNIQHSRLRSALLFLALTFFASSLFA